MTEAIASADTSRGGLLKVAAGGVLTGILTPLLPPVIDQINGAPGNLRIAMLAIPFAVLVFILVQRYSANPRWAALAAAVVTMAAFVCAVNAAIYVDGHVNMGKAASNILAGLAGGFTGSTVMSLGIGLLPGGPRDAAAWSAMVAFGTIAGALLALDSALNLDLVSILFPVWQAGVAVGLTVALRRTKSL